ncbi:MAG: hypothetical protein KDH48_27775 [Rhodoferax sp.]|nr:hypothetical protein [Rhodoferax sp.]
MAVVSDLRGMIDYGQGRKWRAGGGASRPQWLRRRPGQRAGHGLGDACDLQKWLRHGPMVGSTRNSLMTVA